MNFGSNFGNFVVGDQARRAAREAEMMAKEQELKQKLPYGSDVIEATAQAGTAYRATEMPSQPMWISNEPQITNKMGNMPGFSTTQAFPSWGGVQPPSAILGEAIRLGSTVQGKLQSAESKVWMGTGMINTLPNQLAANANNGMPGMTTTNFLVNGAQNSVSALGSLGFPGM